MLGEELQQLELLEREIQGTVAQPRAVGGFVDGQVAGADLVRRRWSEACLPPDGEPQPGLNLGRPGGAENHVVGAPVGRHRGQATFGQHRQERDLHAHTPQQPA